MSLKHVGYVALSDDGVGYIRNSMVSNSPIDIDHSFYLACKTKEQIKRDYGKESKVVRLLIDDEVGND